jgi:stage II sporulation protein AA (anti-sigma F factor antagonist)
MAGIGLTAEVEDCNGIGVVHIAGPLDPMTHDTFRSKLDPLVAPSRFRLVLDCEKLTYVNSTGLTLLARYHRSALQARSFFGIAALNPRILKAIDLLGMGNLVKPYPTVADALRAAETV